MWTRWAVQNQRPGPCCGQSPMQGPWCWGPSGAQQGLSTQLPCCSLCSRHPPARPSPGGGLRLIWGSTGAALHPPGWFCLLRAAKSSLAWPLPGRWHRTDPGLVPAGGCSSSSTRGEQGPSHCSHPPPPLWNPPAGLGSSCPEPGPSAGTGPALARANSAKALLLPGEQSRSRSPQALWPSPLPVPSHHHTWTHPLPTPLLQPRGQAGSTAPPPVLAPAAASPPCQLPPAPRGRRCPPETPVGPSTAREQDSTLPEAGARVRAPCAPATHPHHNPKAKAQLHYPVLRSKQEENKRGRREKQLPVIFSFIKVYASLRRELFR